jgi:Flp pilus assembly protein TadG
MSVRSLPRPAARSDRGQVSIEFLGFLPILLAIALAAVQLGIGAYTAQQAGTAARAAARTASLDDPLAAPEDAGRAAISGWLADGTRISVAEGGDETTATAAVQIPSVIPGIGFGEARRSATMRLPGN